MKLPSSVRIGNHIYGIRQVVDLKDNTGEYMGWNEPHNLDIAIRENTPDSLKLEVLMHEVIHGMLNDTVFYGSKNNEAITVSLTRPLLYFIADNPEYIRFIQKEVERVRRINDEKHPNQRRVVKRTNQRVPAEPTAGKSNEPSGDQPASKHRRRRRTAVDADQSN